MNNLELSIGIKKMDDKLTTLQKHLELKYEGHDFNWRESGKRIIGLCPEHPDRNPSFNVFQYNDKAYFKCFSCGFHGSLYDFIQEGISPEQKEKYALNKQNQKRLWESFVKMKDYLLTADTVEAVFARKYLTEKRYLDMSAVKKGNIGLISTNKEYEPSYERLKIKIDDLLSGENKISNYSGWLVFAHTNVKGDICRLKFREPDTKNIRTANIKGCEDEPAAFGLKSIGGRDSVDYPVSPYIYITEGEFNYLQYINATDIGNIVSAGGKDNISLKLINTLLNLDFIPVVALDQDNAGEKQLRKIYEQTPAGHREKIVYCEYGGPAPDGTLQKDFDDIFKNKSSDGVNEVLSSFKYKTFDRFQEIINEENLNEEIKIEKFINDNILGHGLKEIYLDKYKISAKSQVKIYNIEDVLADKTEEKFNGIFPVGVSTLAGYPGSGKTYSAIYIALFYAIDNPEKKVFLWLSEDSKAQVRKRINYLLTKNKIKMPKNIFFCFDIALPIFEKQFGGYVESKFYMNVRETILGYSLIFLDPLVDFSVGIDENGNGGIAQFLLAFKEISKEKDASIVFLHHVNKVRINTVANPEFEWITTEEKNDRLFKVRGASAVAGSSRLVLYCESNPKKENERIISVIKFNSGPEGKILYRVELPAKPINHNYEKHENKKMF